VKIAVNKTEISSEAGNERKVTPSLAAAAGDGSRAASVTQMMSLLRDTRQQIGEMRQRTEKALAFIQQVDSERREQLENFQAAKTHLNCIHSQLAKIVSYSNSFKQATSSEQLLPDKSKASAQSCLKPDEIKRQ